MQAPQTKITLKISVYYSHLNISYVSKTSTDFIRIWHFKKILESLGGRFTFWAAILVLLHGLIDEDDHGVIKVPGHWLHPRHCCVLFELFHVTEVWRDRCHRCPGYLFNLVSNNISLVGGMFLSTGDTYESCPRKMWREVRQSRLLCTVKSAYV